MANAKPEDEASKHYWGDLILNNRVVKELRNNWVFEDVTLESEKIKKMYEEHRLKAIRSNWTFILLILKIQTFIIFILFQFQEEYMPLHRRLFSATMFLLVFVLKYLIYKSKFVAKYGAIFYVLVLGLMMTRANLEITEFRIYEGFLFHISVSFLLSTCLISDWRISSAAVLLIYSNLYFMLKAHFDWVPTTVSYSLGFAVAIFAFNAFLISRSFKQEFLSTFQAKQASSQLKKILEELPEGVIIMNEQGDDLKFINKKLKQTFDVSSFYQNQDGSKDIAKIKESVEEILEEIEGKSVSDSMNFEDTQKLNDFILSNFVVRIRMDRIEEGKGEDPDIYVGDFEEVPLPVFLQEERELSNNEQENERSTKASISYTQKHFSKDIENLYRDFIVKTSKIDYANDHDKDPTFLQMFIDTTQITQLEEAKAQSNYQKQMLSNVSHEFRTPLNAMSLSLHLMKAHITEDLAKFHRIASSSCDILGGLVEDILDFSKIEAGVFEVHETVFTFKELFGEAKSIFEMQTQMKGINLNFQMDDAFIELKIKSDKQRVKQILLNLISNALKFTDRGFINVNLRICDTLQLETEQINNSDFTTIFSSELTDEMPVCNLLLVTDNYMSTPNPSKFNPDLNFSEPGNPGPELDPQEAVTSEFTKELKVELIISDSGIGIPECDLPSLFKVFGKTRSNHNRNQTGTGLGLTICKKLCEKLGGKISLKSQEGVGTEVTCSFTCLY
ncbi:unnamed protein product [Moneuplotes crassus]|uniref:histidine kinase n=1 Tax=Euplotes crassus TaxID=5936 RepID=A0AAD2DBD6_EUPCR|nr:unnamed protein product [Moneuplotes crassus]